MNGAGGGLRGADRSLRLCVGLLTKTLLQNLGPLRDQPSFPKLWDATLQVSVCQCSAERCMDCSACIQCIHAHWSVLPVLQCASLKAVGAHCGQVLGDAKRNRSEALAEAVPEALKNALLVMAAQGLLTPAWTVRACVMHADCGMQRAD